MPPVPPARALPKGRPAPPRTPANTASRNYLGGPLGPSESPLPSTPCCAPPAWKPASSPARSNQALDDDGNFLNPISYGPLHGFEMTHGQNLNHALADGCPRPSGITAGLSRNSTGSSLSVRNYRTNRFSRPNPNPLSRLRPLQTNPFGPRKTLRATPGPLGSGSHSSLPALVPAGLRSAPLAIPLRCRAPGHARGSTAHPVRGKPPPPTSPPQVAISGHTLLIHKDLHTGSPTHRAM